MVGDETEYLQPVLGLLPSQRFKPLNSSWTGLILLFFIVVMEGLGLATVLLWPKNSLQCEPLYMLLYIHAALWFLILLLDHILKWHHNKLRLEGYLAAYELMTKVGSLPFYIVSLVNTVLLVLVVVYQQVYPVLEKACTHQWDSPLIISLVIVSVEATTLSYILIKYLVNVHKFNKARSPPDVTSVDTWDAFTSHEVGYRERGEDVEELLQKQADSIRYYKHAIEVLNRKIMGLTAQLRGDSIN